MMRELAHRTADNGRIAISLDWESDANEVTLTLADERGAEQVTIPGEDATRAYEHPYAYLAALHPRSDLHALIELDRQLSQ
jgi:hypothetical protein